jgi:hypothetical protein
MEDDAVTPSGLGNKTHLVYTIVVDQGKLYTDLTGKFPLRSSKGNWYVILCYSYDCNYVKVVPMKSRSASEWVKSYEHIHQELTSKGFKPKLQTLDNEASAALKSFFTTNDVEYQLPPPLTAIGATPLNGLFTLSKNILSHVWIQLTQIPHYTYGIDLYHKLK